MHKQLLLKVIGVCRRRINDGDCPTVQPFDIETLENAVVELADRVMALEPKMETDKFTAPKRGTIIPY